MKAFLSIFFIVSTLTAGALAGNDGSCAPIEKGFNELSSWIQDDIINLIKENYNSGWNDEEWMKILDARAEYALIIGNLTGRDIEILEGWLSKQGDMMPKWELQIKIKVWKCVVDFIIRDYFSYHFEIY